MKWTLDSLPQTELDRLRAERDRINTAYEIAKAREPLFELEIKNLRAELARAEKLSRELESDLIRATAERDEARRKAFEEAAQACTEYAASFRKFACEMDLVAEAQANASELCADRIRALAAKEG
jgi:hypothetical protein